MTKLNLLPWRETHRREKNIEFGITTGIFAVLTMGLVFVGLQFAQSKVDFQNERNGRLNSEIVLLQQELMEIKELEKTKNDLLSRMEIVQELQAQRPKIVHILSEIASNLPDGVYLTSMRQEGDTLLLLEGQAESNARVSALMRQLNESTYLSNPKLEIISADKAFGRSTFKLSMISDSGGKANNGEGVDNGV